MRFKLFMVAVVTSVMAVALGCSKKDVSVYDPTVEMQVEPLAVGTSEPCFSWKLFSESRENVIQESYRILVSSDPKSLKKGKADLWDSGEVKSSQSVYVPYEGAVLSSRKTAYV